VGLKAVLGTEGLLAEGADLAARPVVVRLEVLLHVAGVETDLLTDAAAHLTCSRSEKGSMFIVQASFLTNFSPISSFTERSKSRTNFTVITSEN
jgi:hypothetical protein